MKHFRYTSLCLSLILFFGLVDPFGEVTNATQVEPQADPVRNNTYSERKNTASPRKNTPRNKGLARLTVYWAIGTGTDYWSSRKISASGATLKAGVCAVDPKLIQYGSKVTIPGIGTFTAVDTGSDVRSRKAARLLGKTVEEQAAQVIDIFFENKTDALDFARTAPHFANIEWSGNEAATPQSM
jgi:3D (Asp-Asp-Asp) domain-containing protein